MQMETRCHLYMKKNYYSCSAFKYDCCFYCDIFHCLLSNFAVVFDIK